MEIQILDIINVLTPIVSLLVGWLLGKRKQKNDFLNELQASVDLLAEKNKSQMEEIIKLREEVIKWRNENSELRQEVETLNQKLEGVKTITRNKL